MWSRDWPRPKLKEIWSFKLQDFNVLEFSKLGGNSNSHKSKLAKHYNGELL